MLNHSRFTIVVGLLIAGCVAFTGCGKSPDESHSEEKEKGEDHSGQSHGDSDKKSDQGKDGNAESKVKAYPLDICVVSKKKLGSMGEAESIEHDGQTVKFCCAGCIGRFKKDPEKYLKLITEGKK